MNENESEKKSVGEQFFELMLALREHHILIGGTLLFSLVSGITFLHWHPILLTDELAVKPWVIGLRVFCLIAIPLFAAADKIADAQSKKKSAAKQTENDTRAQQASNKAQKAYNQSISSLLALAKRGANIAFETPGNRKVPLIDLRTVLATATHGISIVAKTRATYYTLEFTEKGRILKDPVSFGRVEESTTIWEEAEDPNHPVWSIMDGEDLNAPIVRSSDPSKEKWADWDSKQYRSFISVPVKAQNAQFGMLSLNAPNSEDLTETDRMGVLVAARLMATTLALGLPQQEVKDLALKLSELQKRQRTER